MKLLEITLGRDAGSCTVVFTLHHCQATNKSIDSFSETLDTSDTVVSQPETTSTGVLEQMKSFTHTNEDCKNSSYQHPEHRQEESPVKTPQHYYYQCIAIARCYIFTLACQKSKSAAVSTLQGTMSSSSAGFKYSSKSSASLAGGGLGTGGGGVARVIPSWKFSVPR
uniref:Uncharacterized protein n=1 Tax=Timema monikensis TaxID=170555 RepID=A0A7R9EJQ8_9NEOP|nr:unnamed protein product [Timema monikensis]